MKKTLAIAFILFAALLVKAQNPYWVMFTDKQGVQFNPHAYFVPKALERIARNGLNPCDLANYPVKNDYIHKVGSIADSTGFASRWFNMLETYATPAERREILRLPFVKSIKPMTTMTEPATVKDSNELAFSLDSAQIRLIRQQVRHMEGHKFHAAEITGKGVRIAIFDGGFPGVNTHPAFAHTNRKNRIVKTWDYPDDQPNVFAHNSHGTAVMSCITGLHDTLPIGLALDASFLLARTEIRSEPFSEEKNWLAAAEWASKNGADIINSSLGYTHHRYFPEEMDGKRSLVARAADMAASMGILVVNAMGNSGLNPYWEIAGTPADADSVLSVGGIHPQTGYHTSFSSFGPTADMRRKPNVTAIAHVIAASPTGFKSTQGTSFSSPLVAGFAACALQAKPELTAMELFREIEHSGHLHPYYDYAHGYGIPKASHFLQEPKTPPAPTFEFVKREDQILIRAKDVYVDKISPENYLYYHLEKPNGVLKKYGLIRVKQQEVYKIATKLLKEDFRLRAHYKGYTQTYNP